MEEALMVICRRFVLAGLAVVLLGGRLAAEEVRGVIEKVDPAKGELTIEARGRGVRGLAMSFVLAKDTQVRFGRQEAAVADLKPGARAVILYDSNNGRRIARSITVRGALPKAESVKTDANTVVGTVARVAAAQRELVVLGPGPEAMKTEKVLTVPEDASITRDKKAIKLDDIRAGESVVARTAQRDGKTVVESVEVGVPARTAANAQRIEQARRVLRMVDFFLQRMGQRNEPPAP
jgi:hypothetical protein